MYMGAYQEVIVVFQAKDYSDLKQDRGSEDGGLGGFNKYLRGKIHRT